MTPPARAARDPRDPPGDPRSRNVVDVPDPHRTGASEREVTQARTKGERDQRDALDAVAWLLDDVIRIPGTSVRVGLDPILGLIPGIGDLLGSLLGTIVLVGAVRHRVPLHVLVRMGWNLVVDKILGLVPVIGDAADVAHRANAKNYRLLRTTVAQGRTIDTDAKGYALRAGALVGVVLVVLIAAGVLAIWGLWEISSALVGA